MRRVLPLLAMMSLALAPAPVYREKPDQGRDDLKAMQGDWKLVYCEMDGRRIDPARKVPQGLMTIKGDRMLNLFRIDCQIALDPRRLPKTIDGTGTDPDNGHPARMLGIYEIKGDVLTACFSSSVVARERPAAFKAPGYIFRFERKKP